MQSKHNRRFGLVLQAVFATLLVLLVNFSPSNLSGAVSWQDQVSKNQTSQLEVKQDKTNGKILIHRVGNNQPILTQNAAADFRPFLHPIVAPDGNGVFTQFSPGHHKHQTGLYWGITRVNGRDYFHHPEGDYWRRVSASVLKPASSKSDTSVSWRTVYDMLGKSGDPVMRETQTWTMRDEGGSYILDLVWKGESLLAADKGPVTIGKYDYGGLFLRMPWTKKTKGKVVNSARQSDQRAEGQRAVWLDVGMEIDGRDDQAHIAIFDHPSNEGFPMPWRVDGQMGVGPVRARMGDWTIEKDKPVTVRHQLHVYSGELNDVELTEKWSTFSGKPMAYSQWWLAQQEGKAAEFLTPEKAVEAMDVMDGFEVNLFASEPMMTQPMAFCWDDQGRLWIAENRDYESRQKGFSNFGDSRILILEDTDHDGIADKRKVFLEGIPFPAGIAVGMGGLWLGAPPNLLFVPDANKDDKADLDNIEVRLTGWGIKDRHETLNSFHWGPDGWLYGCQGFATPSKVGKPKGSGKVYKHKEPFPKDIEFAEEPVDINGGIWRYHPTKDKFEVVAHGFSNPWGIDYDKNGQLFVTACVIPHLWHVIPGGIYHRQGGSHFNQHVYSDIRTIADHRHRSAHGGARIYQSGTFPVEHRDRIFMANIHEHAVLSDELEPKGSGFVGHHGDELLHANNAQWVGFSCEIGPEGGLYILDWHDGNICGSEVLNKQTGRVFRLMPKDANVPAFENRFADLSKLSDLQLAKFQGSSSNWHARRARVILQHRASERKIDSDALSFLREAFGQPSKNGVRKEEDQVRRLRSFWTLHVVGAITEDQYLSALDHRGYERGWAIQMLCEDHSPSDAALAKFISIAQSETSPVERLYLAIALQRLGEGENALEARWKIAESLTQVAKDADDHNLPKMIWFGTEPLVVANPERALKLANESKIPMLTQYVARRLTSAGKLEKLVDLIGQSSNAQGDLLEGMRQGMDGRYDLKAPSNWADVFRGLRSQGTESARMALFLSAKFGDSVASKALVETLLDANAPVEDRMQSLRGLADRKRPELKGNLVGMLNDSQLDADIRKAIIRAFAAFEDESLGTALLKRYPTLDTHDKLETVIALSSRSSYGRMLTDAIKSGDVPRSDVPAYVARALQRVVGNGFLEVWGPIGGAEDSSKLFEKYQTLLTPEKIGNADLGKGRVVFNSTCQACHKLYGEGGVIGPEITGANRTNLDYLLGNILTPSADIQDAYRMQLVLMDDGRMFSGIPADENKWQLNLRIANQDDPISIPKSQIEDRETSKMSMMPKGLMDNLSDEEVVNLIAYLKHLEQVPLPEPASR
ncbi:MAG: PVC-type heme-binding CxxCH protein [Mariniblastus sp.]